MAARVGVQAADWVLIRPRFCTPVLVNCPSFAENAVIETGGRMADSRAFPLSENDWGWPRIRPVIAVVQE